MKHLRKLHNIFVALHQKIFEFRNLFVSVRGGSFGSVLVITHCTDKKHWCPTLTNGKLSDHKQLRSGKFCKSHLSYSNYWFENHVNFELKFWSLKFGALLFLLLYLHHHKYSSTQSCYVHYIYKTSRLPVSNSSWHIVKISLFVFNTSLFLYLFYKNPAYGRHQLSRLMRIVGPIQIWRGCVIYL